MKNLKLLSSFLSLAIAIFVGGLTASASELTEEQKLEYYNEYAEIIDEINGGNPVTELTLEPFESFEDKDFVSPEVFETNAIEHSNLEFNQIKSIVPKKNSIGTLASLVSATSTEEVSSKGSTVTLTIKSSFYTYYNSTNLRQLFSSVSGVTVTPNKGFTWSKLSSPGYTASLIDGGRTYNLIITGKLTLNGASSQHNVEVSYFCNTDGSVSVNK